VILRGARVTLRTGGDADADALRTILEEPSVAAWWGEPDPRYRHAAIDIFLGGRFQDHGLGTEALRLLAGHLFDERGHHRLTIDPAAANERAIRAYEKVGFRPVGVMRRYERGPDGRFHDGLLMDVLRDDLS
jgi:aminoglycoside 6'-N-acetyltransferase